MCCGVVPILFGWFLSVPSLHVHVFLWKTFLDLSITVLIGDGREFQWLVEEWFRGSVRVRVMARAREYF